MTFSDLAKLYPLAQYKAQLFADRDAGKLAFVKPGEEIEDFTLMCCYCGQLRQIAEEQAENNEEYSAMMVTEEGYLKTLSDIIAEVVGQDFILRELTAEANRKRGMQQLLTAINTHGAQQKKRGRPRKNPEASRGSATQRAAAAGETDPAALP